jgi:L-asparagine transporter-like permease
MVKPKKMYAAITVPKNLVDPGGMFPTETRAILSVTCSVSIDSSAVEYTGSSHTELKAPTHESRNPNCKTLR